jgi:hypothetical protein
LVVYGGGGGGIDSHAADRVCRAAALGSDRDMAVMLVFGHEALSVLY